MGRTRLDPDRVVVVSYRGGAPADRLTWAIVEPVLAVFYGVGSASEGAYLNAIRHLSKGGQVSTGDTYYRLEGDDAEGNPFD